MAAQKERERPECVKSGGPRTLGALVARIPNERRCVGPKRQGLARKRSARARISTREGSQSLRLVGPRVVTTILIGHRPPGSGQRASLDSPGPGNALRSTASRPRCRIDSGALVDPTRKGLDDGDRGHGWADSGFVIGLVMAGAIPAQPARLRASAAGRAPPHLAGRPLGRGSAAPMIASRGDVATTQWRFVTVCAGHGARPVVS